MRKIVKAGVLLVLAISFAFFLKEIRISAKAADELTGGIDITYSASTGKLTVNYDGSSTISDTFTYTWYKDSSSVATGGSYVPTAAGNYYCKAVSSSYTGTLTSSQITLYKASGSNVTFDNSYGLYEGGETVTVTATLSGTQEVSNWKTNVAGVEIPQTGQTVSFKMPYSNITVTATLSSVYTIKMVSGTASSYTAHQGDIITIKASSISGQTFTKWTSSGGGTFAETTAEVTVFTMPAANVTITANYETATTTNTSTSSSDYSDATHIKYEILSNGGYSVQVYRHDQGPLCDIAFKYAQGINWLVTDYLNITVNNSLTTYSTSNTVKIRLTIPDDLIATGRKWYMICISEGGTPYYYEDEDSSDSTITFTTDKFYAYAMCYNDYGDLVTTPSQEDETTTTSSTTSSSTSPTSNVKSAADSQTSSTSSVKNSTSSVTEAVENGDIATSSESETKIDSNKKSSINQANGATLDIVNM